MTTVPAVKTSLGAPVGHIAEQGLSIVHDPVGPVLVDIVFIHGLQGHPFKTWASTRPPLGPAKSDDANTTQPHHPATSPKAAGKRESKRRKLAELVVGMARGSSHKRGAAAPVASSSSSGPIHCTNNLHPPAEAMAGIWFWPRDSVPQRCPDARVLTWGYDTHVTRFFGGASCKGTVLSHAKDLLFSLARSREQPRPLMFVAHSLGGIVVKEMLSASEQSDDEVFRQIVGATAAVIFLGTPHRGSLDLVHLGNMGRAVVGALGFDTTTAVLDALGLKTSDLERSQESFSRLWRKYDFEVKTFQESLGLSGANIGPLNDQVVPGFSSLLGDAREHAETLHANHRNMCRYSGPDDPNQARVVGEIARLYQGVRTSIPPEDARHPASRLRSPPSSVITTSVQPHLSPRELRELRAILKSLYFKGIQPSRLARHQPAPGTCEWIFQDPTFLDWHHRRNTNVHKGLLWLLGNPGSGKSTLMQEIYYQLSQGDHRPGGRSHVLAFFFNAGGAYHSDLEGLYCSLLYQLLQWRSHDTYQCAKKVMGTDAHGRVQIDAQSWSGSETIRRILRLLVLMPSSLPTIILIDALDECSSYSLTSAQRGIGMFFRELTISAHDAGVQLHVCISCRYYGASTTRDCLKIMMEHHNSRDIASYVNLTLDSLSYPAAHLAGLKKQILEMSQGIFLWVVLAVDLLTRDLEAGKNIRYLENHLCSLPDGLDDLFRDILMKSQKDRYPRLRFFQWAILGGEGMQLREWRHILPFLGRPPPRSLQESRLSAYYADTDEQLVKLIRHLSLGLVHVVEKTTGSGGEPGSAAGSTAPDAGSLDSAQGDTRIVGPIHGSVRKFFLDRGGFSTLAGESEVPITAQHGDVAIMHTCLDFIELADFDAIVSARQEASATQFRSASTPAGLSVLGSERPGTPSLEAGSVRSYHSAGSSRYSMDSNSVSGTFPETARTRTTDHGKPCLREHTLAQLFREDDTVLRERRLTDFFQADGVGGPAFVAGDAAAPPPTLSAGSSVESVRARAAAAAATSWEYPDCTPYVLAAFLRHAKRAQSVSHFTALEAGAKDVFARLSGQRLWRRWLALAEERDQHVTLVSWARRHGLERWETLALEDTARLG